MYFSDAPLVDDAPTAESGSPDLSEELDLDFCDSDTDEEVQ